MLTARWSFVVGPRSCTLQEAEAVMRHLRAHGEPRLLSNEERENAETHGRELKRQRATQVAAAQASCSMTAEAVARLSALRWLAPIQQTFM